MKRRNRVAPLAGVVRHNGVGDFDSYLFESSTALRAVRLMQVVISFGFGTSGRDFTIIAPTQNPLLPDPIVRWAELQTKCGGDREERETVRELQAGGKLGDLIRGLEIGVGQIVAFELAELAFVKPPEAAVMGFKVEVIE